MKRFSQFLLAAAVAVGLSSAASAQEVRMHGSSTFFNKIMKTQQGAIEKESGVKLKVDPNGSGRGVADLLSGKADMAMSSSTLEALVSKINKRKPGSVDESKLKAHFITLTRAAFVVHPSNPVKKLSLFQLRDILSGKITNWKQVGGPSKPIEIIAEDASGGLRTFVEKLVLKGGTISGTVKEHKSGSDIVPAVAKSPNAIGVAAHSTLTKSVREVETVIKVVQPLILITLGEPNAQVAKVIAATKKAANAGS